MKGYEWIQKVRKELDLPSDYKAAEMIGLTRSTVSQHKSGKAKTLADSQCIRIAMLLDIEPTTIIADQHLEAAKTPEEQSVWRTFVKLSGSAAAVIFSVTTALPQDVLSSVHCILCKIRKANLLAVKYSPLPA